MRQVFPVSGWHISDVLYLLHNKGISLSIWDLAAHLCHWHFNFTIYDIGTPGLRDGGIRTIMSFLRDFHFPARIDTKNPVMSACCCHWPSARKVLA
jgi:hypothetical protein